MKIGIDARPLIGQRTGIGNYLFGIVQALGRIANGHTFVLYSPRALPVPLPGPQWQSRIYRGLIGTNGTLWLQWHGRRLAERDDIDVFWGAHFLLPVFLRRNIPAVVTAYDLVAFRYPRTMQWRNLLALRVLLPPSLARADHIMAISHATGQDLQRYLGVPADRITVVPPGVAPTLAPVEPEDARTRVARTLAVEKPYLLAVGTLEPRKNLVAAIRAFATLAAGVRRENLLVVAGAAGWRNSSLHAEAAPLVAEGTLRFLGYVPDAELPALYSGARALCFPSLYEGFGIPVIEAMACGSPVLASDIPVLREVAADAAVFMPPEDTSSWAEAMRDALTTDRYASLREKGLRRARKFTFDRSARLVLEVFSRVAHRKGADGH